LFGIQKEGSKERLVEVDMLAWELLGTPGGFIFAKKGLNNPYL
jgi:hypothetical protein